MSLLRHSAAWARKIFLSDYPRRQHVVFVILLNERVTFMATRKNF